MTRADQRRDLPARFFVFALMSCRSCKRKGARSPLFLPLREPIPRPQDQRRTLPIINSHEAKSMVGNFSLKCATENASKSKSSDYSARRIFATFSIVFQLRIV